MQWEKQGLLFDPQKDCAWCVSHAAVPIADQIDGDRYRIYFTSRDELSRSQIGFFEVDIRQPRHILHVADKPVLASGEPGMFDDSGTMTSWLVSRNGVKYLYCIGWNRSSTVPFRNAIGLAISHDGGKSFSRYSDGPILDRSIHDPAFTASCCVLVEGNRWRMWYLSGIRWDMSGGRPKHYYHIKYAESLDGIAWDRAGVVCIDFESKDEYAISRPCVIKEDGIYRMWYSYRGASYRIGYAESIDGVRWTRKDRDAGIDVSATGWDSEMIEYPFVFVHDGKRYLLYNGNDYGKTGIGYAIRSE
jgi:hypothetical protein